MAAPLVDLADAVPEAVAYVVLGEMRVCAHHLRHIPHLWEPERSRPHVAIRATRVILAGAPLARCRPPGRS